MLDWVWTTTRPPLVCKEGSSELGEAFCLEKCIGQTSTEKIWFQVKFGSDK